MNVFGYLRVSSKKQVDGDGFPRQAEKIRAFCTAHKLKLKQLFHEEAVSGTVECLDRPRFAEMLAEIEMDSSVEIIVVERMDRLARDLMVSELLLAECRKRNIRVFSADQGALIDMASDGGEPTRILIRQIMGAMAEWDKTMTVRRLRAARDRMRARGERCEGPKPFGSFPGEQAIMNSIFELRATGMTLQRTADFLNESGVNNKNSRDGKWSKTVIANFLNRHNQRMNDAKVQKEKEEVGQVLI